MKKAALLVSTAVLLAATGCSVDERLPDTVTSASSSAGASGNQVAGGAESGADGSDVGAPRGSFSGAAGSGSTGGAATPEGNASPFAAGSSAGAAGDGAASGGAGSSSAPGGGAPSGSAPSGSAPSGGAPSSSAPSGGAGSPDAPCGGCVELVVPVTGPEQGASFQFNFPAPGVDFSAGRVVWRLQVLEQDTSPGFFLTTDVQNGAAHSFAGLFENYRPLSTFSFPPGEWVELAVDVSQRPPAEDGSGFDRRQVEIVALALGTTEDFQGTGTIRVFVDSVQITGVSGAASATFDGGLDDLRLNPFDPPPGTGQPIHHP